MRVSGLLVTVLVGAGAVYLWLERPFAGWLDRSSANGGTEVSARPSAPVVHHADGRENRPDARPPVPPPSGEYIEIALLGAPATYYSDEPSVDIGSNEQAYRTLCAEVAQTTGKAVLYDSALGRAAREVAYYTGVNGHAPPEAALTFLLHASGASESSAAQFFTHSTSDELDVVRDTLERALAGDSGPRGDGALRVGIGEVSTPDGTYTRHVSVLATRREYRLQTTPRTAPFGATWILRGELPAGYREAQASVLYPDGRMETAAIEPSGRDFTVAVPAGDVPGTVFVSVDGVDGHGPGKLLQVSFVVGAEGDPPPADARIFVPERDGAFASVAEAEMHALDLLGSDRARFGLPLLAPDAALGAIARAHSEEMRDSGFFGHLSPTTGLAADRLQAAGYRATMHAENLARNDSLVEAQAALMASVGHRKNILDNKPTHVGIGVARLQAGERIEWFVTQIFAKPVVVLDVDEMRAQLIARIDRGRVAAGLEPVREHERMSEVAEEYAHLVAGGELEGVARRALADLSELQATMSASVHAIYDVDSFELPDTASEAKVRDIGVGIVQSADDAHGRTGIVLIFAHAK